MRKVFLVILAFLSLSACKKNFLTDQNGGLFRDRANDYKTSPQLGKHLTEPKGVKFVERNSVYEIPKVNSNGPDVMEADLPAEIILLDRQTGLPLEESSK